MARLFRLAWGRHAYYFERVLRKPVLWYYEYSRLPSRPPSRGSPRSTDITAAMQQGWGRGLFIRELDRAFSALQLFSRGSCAYTLVTVKVVLYTLDKRTTVKPYGVKPQNLHFKVKRWQYSVQRTYTCGRTADAQRPQWTPVKIHAKHTYASFHVSAQT